MKQYLVTLHCGQQIMSTSPSKRFCNRKCSGYFVSRRPGAKKRNKTVLAVNQQPLLHTPDHWPSDDPVWRTAKKIVSSQGYVDRYFWSSDLGIQYRRREHIIVWEIVHGQRVPVGWVIHHRDGDRANNDPTNLVAMTKSMHMELHRQLEALATRYAGIDLVVQRHKLNEKYVQRATDLLDRNQNWFE